MSIKRRTVKISFAEGIFGASKDEIKEIKRLGSTPYGLRPGATIAEKENFMKTLRFKRG